MGQVRKFRPETLNSAHYTMKLKALRWKKGSVTFTRCLWRCRPCLSCDTTAATEQLSGHVSRVPSSESTDLGAYPWRGEQPAECAFRARPVGSRLKTCSLFLTNVLLGLKWGPKAAVFRPHRHCEPPASLHVLRNTPAHFPPQFWQWQQ